MNSQADTESYSTPTATKHAIIDLGDLSSRLASDIIGVRRSDDAGFESTVWVDLASLPGIVVIDCETEDAAIKEHGRILAEWKAALSAT